MTKPAHWDSGLAQSHDGKQSSNAAESRKGENNELCHHRETDTISNSTCVSRTPTDGTWLSSTQSNSYKHPANDMVQDYKTVPGCGWSFLSGPSPSQLVKLSDDQTLDPNESGRKGETVASCRLFGIDLNHLAKLPAEKASSQPSSVSSDTDGRISTLSVAQSDPKSDNLEVSVERKSEPLQASLKETQSSLTNTRSRTKVQKLNSFT